MPDAARHMRQGRFTAEDARKFIEIKLNTTDKEGETYFVEIGALIGEDETGFEFVGYPYSSKHPIDYNYAFQYFLIKATKKVGQSNCPIYPDELKKIAGAGNER
jgi:hypothetical protein